MSVLHKDVPNHPEVSIFGGRGRGGARPRGGQVADLRAYLAELGRGQASPGAIGGVGRCRPGARYRSARMAIGDVTAVTVKG